MMDEWMVNTTGSNENQYKNVKIQIVHGIIVIVKDLDSKKFENENESFKDLEY